MTHVSFKGNDELILAIYMYMWGNITANIFNHPANNTKILYYYHSAKITYHVASSRITILYISKILHLPKHKTHKLLLTNSVMV